MRGLLCFQLTRNVHFNWDMYNFKFNYLLRGQLASLNLDKIFLPLLKILLCYEGFFGNLIFAIIARMLYRNHLNHLNWREALAWWATWLIYRLYLKELSSQQNKKKCCKKSPSCSPGCAGHSSDERIFCGYDLYHLDLNLYCSKWPPITFEWLPLLQGYHYVLSCL